VPKLIRGRYKPLEVVGAGGQGQVVRALDRQHDRLVALKVRPAPAEERSALLREARILLGLRPHPGLPVVRDDFFVGESYYMAMDWIPGTNLERLLDKEGDPGLPLERVLTYLEQAASALTHLHGHDPPIVHRDVKPSNLILTPDRRVVLVDFGIASHREHLAGKPFGTWGFVAPELVAGQAATPVADVFGLAATAFTLLCGSPPKWGVPPSWPGWNKAAARRVERALRAGLALDPAARPSGAAAFVGMLRPKTRAVRRRPGPHNLPAPLTSFIGRRREMTEVRRLLSSTRLLTLTGAGGVGKTRLALQVAGSLLTSYRDGVWLVELAQLANADLVTQQVAASVGVLEEPGRSLLATLVDRFEAKTLLLVLDNCEHLLGACAALAQQLLRACPKIQIMTTSREPLRISGETAWRVPSLGVPREGPQLLSKDLKRSEAASLFLERATAANASFVLTNSNAPSVLETCRALDGIPLAIELAAACTNALSAEEIASRLREHLRLPNGGGRAVLPRHRTLRAAIDWSYDLLPEAERILFHRLSVFVGGFTAEAAKQVCRPPGFDEWDLLGHLFELVNKSLVVAEDRRGETRYILLETIRQYALQKLLEADEEAWLRSHHVEWFLALVEHAEPELQGPEQATWLERLETEHDNIRAALEWAINRGWSEASLRLPAALWRFWSIRGHLTEGRGWLSAALGIDDRTRDSHRARALTAAGILAEKLADYVAARHLHEESLAVARELEDPEGIAASLSNLGAVAHELGEYAEAQTLHEESLTIRHARGDRRGMAVSLNNLGIVAYFRGDYETARTLYEQSLAIERELGNEQGIAMSLENLGELARAQADYERARSLYEESLAIERKLGAKRDISNTLNNLGVTACLLGDLPAARSLLDEALALGRELGDRQQVAECLQGLGDLLRAQGDHEGAQSLCEESLAMRRAFGDRRGIASSLKSLGDLATIRGDGWEAEARYGEALTIQHELGHKQGIASCLEGLADVAVSQSRWERAARLLGAADAIRGATGCPLPPQERSDHERTLVRVKKELGPKAFAQARAAGAATHAWQSLARLAGVDSPEGRLRRPPATSDVAGAGAPPS
jgi:non-specific serine/threonine protein kinase